ncbi:M15 family metallopeptidase [Cellulomonas sp. HZM]|uniref:M15 family metallopeptidase n=1 Tax=Cellulomonas sp. HZM TaxID=1454010 RepID=UPI000AD996C0|nr:M15 family metallopeptidase [Cellulomonas sp. HZM]
MTLYIHGRPERSVRRRRRAALVGLASVPVLLAVGVHVAASAAPGVAPALDPELARRFEAAQVAAAADGVSLTLTSGARTVAEQQHLVDDAVDRYGSVAEAHRYVLPPGKSSHVAGLAVDVGPPAGAAWLAKHSVELGLCRTYANEAWHFEKLPDGATRCPKMHPDSSWGW